MDFSLEIFTPKVIRRPEEFLERLEQNGTNYFYISITIDPPYLIIAQVLLLTYLPNLILGWDIIGSTIDPQKREQLSNFQDSSNNQRRKSKILLIGNEGEGVAKSLLDKCNSYTCLQPRLNINTLVDSLNVSVATALLIKQQMK